MKTLYDVLDGILDECADRPFYDGGIDYHKMGCDSLEEYVAGYADGAFDIVLTKKQVSKIIKEYQKYVASMEDGCYSANWDALKENLNIKAGE